jgi:hypothetical protein
MGPLFSSGLVQEFLAGYILGHHQNRQLQNQTSRSICNFNLQQGEPTQGTLPASLLILLTSFPQKVCFAPIQATLPKLGSHTNFQIESKSYKPPSQWLTNRMVLLVSRKLIRWYPPSMRPFCFLVESSRAEGLWGKRITYNTHKISEL